MKGKDRQRTAKDKAAEAAAVAVNGTVHPGAPEQAGENSVAVVEPKPTRASRAINREVEAPKPVTPELTRAIEAILISTDRPVSIGRLSEALAGCEQSDVPAGADAPLSAPEPVPTGRVRAGIDALNQQYEQTGRVFRIQTIAGGYRLMTNPEVAGVLEKYHGARQRASLSRAAIESLAILAYRQPLTRAKLEAIRGVACGEILRSLSERRLVTVVGRAEELGRPLLYGTTKQFLEAFGLSSIKDLPTVEEFKARSGAGADDDDE